jgi:hypothetical protein
MHLGGSGSFLGCSPNKPDKHRPIRKPERVPVGSIETTARRTDKNTLVRRAAFFVLHGSSISSRSLGPAQLSLSANARKPRSSRIGDEANRANRGRFTVGQIGKSGTVYRCPQGTPACGNNGFVKRCLCACRLPGDIGCIIRWASSPSSCSDLAGKGAAAQ